MNTLTYEGALAAKAAFVSWIDAEIARLAPVVEPVPVKPVPNVFDTAGLVAAIKAAKGGEVLILAPGAYGPITIKGQVNAGMVTITGEGAKLLGLDLQKSEGFRFSGLEFDAGASGAYVFRVSASRDVHFDHLHVHGPDAATFAGLKTPPSGISFLNGCEDVSITDSEFHHLNRACGGSGDRVVIARNDLHDLRTDGMMWSDTRDIWIVDNTIRDLTPSAGGHPDGIQFMTTGTSRASENILIARNVLDRGQGAAFQGIFLGDEVGSLPFKNVRILDNLLIGTGYNGIAVGHGENVELERNELLSFEGKTNKTWILIKNTKGLVSRDNQAIELAYNGVTGLVDEGNVKNQPALDGGLAALAARRAS